jgi:hypothetical protein
MRLRPMYFVPDRAGASSKRGASARGRSPGYQERHGIDLTGMRNFVKLSYADSSTLGKQTVYSPKNTGTVSCTAGAATFST